MFDVIGRVLCLLRLVFVGVFDWCVVRSEYRLLVIEVVVILVVGLRIVWLWFVRLVVVGVVMGFGVYCVFVRVVVGIIIIR